MSWDEALFGLAFDGSRRLFGARDKARLTLRLADATTERTRLEVLARLVSGEKLTVRLVDDVGGWRADTILVPRASLVFSSTQANEATFVARALWGVASRSLGFVRPPAASPAHRLIATALAAFATRARFLALAPSLEATLAAIEHALCAQRPRAEDARALAVEALVARALGSATEKNDWAEAAARLAPFHGAELPRAMAALPPLPSPRRRWLRAPVTAAVWLWGDLLEAEAHTSAGGVTPDPGAPSGATTELTKRQSSELERVKPPADALAENPLVHSFEKVHTLDTYKGGSKRVDGDDELGAHQKALDELDVRQLVKTHTPARSVMRADAWSDASPDDADDASSPAEARYDEWDDAHRRWKRQWCRLTSQPAPISPDAAERLRVMRAGLVGPTRGVRALFEALEASRAWQLRQAFGPDVDLDALVSYRASLRAGHANAPKLYATRRRHSRDTAVLLLLDVSMSTDGWVANRRVIDVEKAATLALGDALDGLGLQLAVAGFRSQTHRDCRFVWAKRFETPWAQGARGLVSLEPAGYTRIGPALRHATVALDASGARTKLLLLVSDGKPSDLDHYEGRYGMADVHRAVLEAQARGVVAHALAVDPASRRWLPAMFGHGRASVVDRPEGLVTALAHVTGRALRG